MTNTFDDMLAVINALREQKDVECRPINNSSAEWIKSCDPLPNFQRWEYRIKPVEDIHFFAIDNAFSDEDGGPVLEYLGVDPKAYRSPYYSQYIKFTAAEGRIVKVELV